MDKDVARNLYENIMVSHKTPSARQPVSCEPCRRRKIKCSRSSPPCTTCVRRRCSDRCVYVGSQEDSTSSTTPATKDLVARITNLESLLRRYTGEAVGSGAVDSPTYETVENPMLSPPIESNHNLQSPESYGTVGSIISEDNGGSPSMSVSTTLGHLATLLDGNTRYEPRSSQWNSVLANTDLSTDELVEDTESFLGSGLPFSSSECPSTDGLLLILPPMQHCEYLKNVYLNVFSPLFHILHEPTFNAKYTDFVDDPTSTSISWLAILFVVLSLAVTSLEDNDPVLRDLGRVKDPSVNIRALSKRYRKAAMDCLAKQGVFWGKHNVQSLQALVMLIYAMGHCQEPTWALLGMTYNIAISLACHIDPSSFNLDPILSEERRRCWAGLMMLYTIQNTFHGSPDPLFRASSSTHTVSLPADVNDDSITISGISSPQPGPTQMSYLLFKFKLYDLTAEICRKIFTFSVPSRQTIQDLDRRISMAQETWDEHYRFESMHEVLPVHHTVHLHILHAYSHQLFLLLHRPFFAQSITGLEIPNESQIRCIASAEALLDIHKTLSTTPAFKPYAWYTNGLGSFHAFHAAAVLAVACMMPLYRPQYSKFRGVLEEAVERFEATARRSRICERASKVLKGLLAIPSPNQYQLPATIEAPKDDLWSDDFMKAISDRLQPQQWLGPASMTWDDWDNLVTHINLDTVPA